MPKSSSTSLQANACFVVADVAACQLEPAARQPPKVAAASVSEGTMCSCLEAASTAAPPHEAASQSTTEGTHADVQESTAAQSNGASPAVSHNGGEYQNGSGGESSRKFRAAGLVCNLPEDVQPEECLWLWLGDDHAPALTELLMSHSRSFACRCQPLTGISHLF